MSVQKERWMFIATILISALFVFLFILPNYKTARLSLSESTEINDSIEQFELRQIQVQNLREKIDSLKSYINDECKVVPANNDISSIIKDLSLDVDGYSVLDQSFTAGVSQLSEDSEKFLKQPFALNMESDFDSLFAIIRRVESMDRLVKICSLRIVRKDKRLGLESHYLNSSIGIHAMYSQIGMDK